MPAFAFGPPHPGMTGDTTSPRPGALGLQGVQEAPVTRLDDPPGEMGEPTSVCELLQRAELLQYADAFEEQGYYSISQLRDITEADLVDLIRDVQMRKGHVKRLRTALGREGSMEGSAGESSNAPAEPKATAPATAPQQVRHLNWSLPSNLKRPNEDDG